MDTRTPTPQRHVRVPSLLRLEPADPAYPLEDGRWQTWAGGPALFEPPTPAPPLSYTGSLAVLHRPRLGLICSSHCPGTIALETYRIARNALAEGPSVIGGFHSPMERTVFDLLRCDMFPSCSVRAGASTRRVSRWPGHRRSSTGACWSHRPSGPVSGVWTGSLPGCATHSLERLHRRSSSHTPVPEVRSRHSYRHSLHRAEP